MARSGIGLEDVQTCYHSTYRCARCGDRDTMKDDLIVGGFKENYLSRSLMHNFETQRDNDQNEEVTANIKRDDIVAMV
uniref:Uncharacterized protein n=1 Tax=Tanacetum cinerariifolium TaxID=118510 RepID=A0A6L2L4V5_TANCI|nr:hypothetical protein [Tanacetum cinerariifolium]